MFGRGRRTASEVQRFSSCYPTRAAKKDQPISSILIHSWDPMHFLVKKCLKKCHHHLQSRTFDPLGRGKKVNRPPRPVSSRGPGQKGQHESDIGGPLFVDLETAVGPCQVISLWQKAATKIVPKCGCQIWRKRSTNRNLEDLRSFESHHFASPSTASSCTATERQTPDRDRGAMSSSWDRWTTWPRIDTADRPTTKVSYPTCGMAKTWRIFFCCQSEMLPLLDKTSICFGQLVKT